MSQGTRQSERKLRLVLPIPGGCRDLGNGQGSVQPVVIVGILK